MTAYQTVAAGWSQDVCIKCTAEPSAQSLTKNLKITQYMDCNDALGTVTPATATAGYSVEYAASSNVIVYDAGVTALFTNAQPTGCPIT